METVSLQCQELVSRSWWMEELETMNQAKPATYHFRAWKIETSTENTRKLAITLRLHA
jgi:hypothetical protein